MQEVLEIIVPVNLDQKFSYLPIAESGNELHIGKRVLVNFAGKVITGVVYGIRDLEDVRKEFNPDKLKQIVKILDTEPLISSNLFQLAEHIARYYICSIGEAIKPMLPAFFNIKAVTRAKFNDNFIFGYDISKSLKKKISAIKPNTFIDITTLLKEYKISKTEMELLYYLNIVKLHKKIDDEIRIPKLFKIKISSNIFDIIDTVRNELDNKTKLKLNSLLDFVNEENHYTIGDITREFKITIKLFKSFIEKRLFTLEETFLENTEFLPPFDLNSSQRDVFEKVLLNYQKNYVYLLQGITGSGKTLVYLYLINEVLKHNQTVIVLIPEIYLTTQLLNRFENVFPNQIAVLHSKVLGSEKEKAYKLILGGKYKIVIGARSAIFAPISNLGMIIVDEEHDQSYKQDSPNPRYNGRDLAIMRSKLEGCTCLLGSATPSIESFYNVQQGKFQYLELIERAEKAKLPDIEVVDLISAKENNELMGTFTKYLIEQIAKNKKRNLVSIIFNNRRGYSNIVECPDCGNVEQCKNCDVTLTYHKEKNELMCHYCDYKIKLKNICAKCGSDKYNYIGYGTQKIEEISSELFENYSILRLDSDVTNQKGAKQSYHSDIKNGKYDIIIGTQLVSKGLDYPNIGLIGVLNADYSLYINDFRSSERTYQLLSQLSGRAGRNKDLESKVIIQTKESRNPLFYYLIKNSTKQFLQSELELRKKADLPPYSRLVMIEFNSLDKYEPNKMAKLFFNNFLRESYFRIYPPLVPEISYIQKMHRCVVVLKVNKEKDKSGKRFSQKIKEYFSENAKEYMKVTVKVNVDIQNPVN